MHVRVRMEKQITKQANGQCQKSPSHTWAEGVNEDTHTHTHTHTHTYRHTYIYASIHTYIHVCMYTGLSLYIHVCVNIYRCIHKTEEKKMGIYADLDIKKKCPMVYLQILT